MASGELSSAEFLVFLRTSLDHAAHCSIDGAIHFVCMDWRHAKEVIVAGEEIYSELKRLVGFDSSDDRREWAPKDPTIDPVPARPDARPL
jgi:hypothetical protein